MHVSVTFIGQNPPPVHPLKYDGKMVPILKHKGGEDPIAIDSLGRKGELFGNFIFKITLDVS
jgi:hypothetical protein